MNKSDYKGDFETLCAQVHSKLAPGGVWNSRKWKANQALRKHIETINLHPHETLDEKIYAIRFRQPERPVCVVCSGAVKLKCQLTGYRRTCSLKCGANDPATKNKISTTLNEKFGGHHTRNKKWIKEFVDDCKEKSSYEKGMKTFGEKYGVENRFQLDSVKTAIKETNVDRYGVENPMQDNEIKSKMRATTLSTHGAFYNPTAAEETNLAKFGSKNAMSNKAVKKRTKDTTLARHGAFFNPPKRKETSVIRYGVEYPMSHPEIAKKSRELAREKFNESRWPIKLENIKLAVNTDLYSQTVWMGADYFYTWEHSCGEIFKDNLVDGKLPICPKCKPRSKPQELIRIFLEELGVVFEENRRGIIGRKEIDFWLPDAKIGIEINGIYWHQDGEGTPLLEKTNSMEALGFSLLHFWDFEINEKLKIVQNIIRAKLGLNNRIFARNTQMCQLNPREAIEFLNHHHLAGHAKAQLHLGLKKGNEIVAVASFSPTRFNKSENFELVRFASKGSVVGGMSKLINAFNILHPNIRLVSFADRRISTGAAYSKLNFVLIAITKPNYFYFKGNKRLSRQQAMKHKLPNLLEVFNPELTEFENMTLNGWSRCSDSGNYKFNL